MMVYCDTSFLISYLNEDDENHSAARIMAGKFARHDFVICEVHQLELPAAMRAATHRRPGGGWAPGLDAGTGAVGALH